MVHTASTDRALLRYELRGNPGPAYSADDAIVIATHQPDDPLVFHTPFALTHPGAQAAFKVYTVLTTGNESGSAEMLVQRPT